MSELARFSMTTHLDTMYEVLKRDGALILENAISDHTISKVYQELRPFIDATAPGMDTFSGHNTTRTGALVSRSRSCWDLVVHPTIKALAERLLLPYCERIQLHLTQAIRIRPGEPSQLLHRGSWAWGDRLAFGVEPQLNTIWALTDFSSANGATCFVPGSGRWADGRQPCQEEIVQAEMSRGSVVIYTGSIFHGAGENRSSEDRVGVNITYSLGWLRQEENQYLSCPPSIASGVPEVLQELLGYHEKAAAFGYYTPPVPPGAAPEMVAPRYAVKLPRS